MAENNVCQQHPVDAGNKQDDQREVHPIFAPILDMIRGEQVRKATKETPK